MYIVVNEFSDRFDNGKTYKAGEKYPRDGFEPPKGRIEALLSGSVSKLNVIGKEFISEVKDTDEDEKENKETELLPDETAVEDNAGGDSPPDKADNKESKGGSSPPNKPKKILRGGFNG